METEKRRDFIYCPNCKLWKYNTEYSKNSSKKNKKCTFCKSCASKLGKIYRQINKDYIEARQKGEVSPAAYLIRKARLKNKSRNRYGSHTHNMIRRGCPWCHAWLFLQQKKGKGFCDSCDLPYSVTLALSDTGTNKGGIMVKRDVETYLELFPTRYYKKTFSKVFFPQGLTPEHLIKKLEIED